MGIVTWSLDKLLEVIQVIAWACGGLVWNEGVILWKLGELYLVHVEEIDGTYHNTSDATHYQSKEPYVSWEEPQHSQYKSAYIVVNSSNIGWNIEKIDNNLHLYASKKV